MHYSTLIVSAFATLSIGAPIVNKRAVFGATTYDAISISGGVAGNALSEADAVLDKLPATPDEADLDFLNEVNQVANDAELAYNDAIAAATGDEAAALEVGKTKNKVLKLEATVLKLTASGDDPAKLEEEKTKLANNVAQGKSRDHLIF